MAILQPHSFRFRNTSTNLTHVVASQASSSVSSHQSVSTAQSRDFGRFVSKLKSNSLNFALSGTVALAVTLSGVGFAEAKVGVNKPELLPKEFTTVIDVAGFLSDGQEKRLAKEIDSIEKDTGFKLRVLAQNYPDTPGLAIKDFWQVDDRTIVFVADPTFGNILNFNVGETVDLDIPRSFWSRLAGKYGNMFYWKEKGEDASVEAAVMAISSCLREPVGANNCAELSKSDESIRVSCNDSAKRKANENVPRQQLISSGGHLHLEYFLINCLTREFNDDNNPNVPNLILLNEISFNLEKVGSWNLFRTCII